jgi:hypothetical protein
MSAEGAYATDTSPPQIMQNADQNSARGDMTLDEVRASLQNLRFGSVTIIVQDGVIIQIDRTEKRRLQQPHRARNYSHAGKPHS